MIATRQEVYAAIDSEREYQNTLARNDVKNQTPMEQAALIRFLLTELDRMWYQNPGYPPMDIFRKIAGVAVRSMEEHGAPKRALADPLDSTYEVYDK